jgi:long-chain acyl-CoA synthetase
MNRLEATREQLSGSFLYSVPVTPKKPGESSVYRRPERRDSLVEVPHEATSLARVWDHSVTRFSSLPAIENYTFAQVDRMVRRVASWLQAKSHRLFFLYALNSIEWTVVDLAAWNYGFVTVPLYDTFGYESFDYILKMTEGTLIFTTKNLIPSLVKYLGTNKRNVTEVCFFS